ncbi:MULTISPECIES: hypothetical protein [unclassified Bosea (in: a-proteobacteria)]|uniref:hypothetical protein n=1 Tax=unclassified Bosea (in: a-proteobacteria) TaxID=2653178 RepID=UPI0009548FFF|nr:MULTISPECIES: hypothetical protein [unclassified Bosea (in: a-proteobacteria)]TAJ33552.1 MAG: hypothetical protein EPO59_04805 [Bosea sp. (in: a-proteobacteria)]SIR54337.1 hypothetical protein SAMN05880592_1299 [Bosea sp. TND4EK4]
MKRVALFVAGLLVAGSIVLPAAAQQNAPPSQPQSGQAQLKQRAPGVPMAPRSDVAGLRAGQGEARPEQRAAAQRTLPMPRGVGSIIAP